MKKIYKEDINKVMPILQALADGKTIQFTTNGDGWIDIDGNEEGLFLEILMATPKRYRIKPEPKYRPFTNTEECWKEMQKHQPIGWVKSKEAPEDVYFTITGLTNGTCRVMLNSPGGWSFSGLFDYYTFADGTPFGIKVGE